jgi:ABC-type uncharacterized transport system fused permease/ATPase subunit
LQSTAFGLSDDKNAGVGATINLSFLTRLGRVVALGFRTPAQDPMTWFVLCLTIISQIAGAYVIQTLLYPLATGVDNNYPGLAGCLKSGCPFAWKNTSTKTTKAVKELITNATTGIARNVTKNVTTTTYAMKFAAAYPAPGNEAFVDDYMREFCWMFGVSMTLVVLMSYFGDVINSRMRLNAAQTVQKRLLNDKTKLLYRLTVDGTMDTVDQRVTADLQIVIDGFCCVFLGNSADYLAYPFFFIIGRMAWSYANSYAVVEMTGNHDKQGKQFGVVIAAVFIAASVYIFPINQVSRCFYRGQKFEGEFRTTHTKAVLSCEQISTLNGEPAEKKLAVAQFERVDRQGLLYYCWQGSLLLLRLFVTLCINACAYVSLAITEISNSTTANYFQKQCGDIFEYSLYFPALVLRIAYAGGATHRVGQLLEKMDRIEAMAVSGNVQADPDRIELRNVCANPPIPEKSDDGTKQAEFNRESKRKLFENVNLVVERGSSVCIIGPSGCGKSSMLRVIGGLWGTESGTVVKPPTTGKDGLFFLPQKPYVFPGTLMEQVCYPNKPADADTLKVKEVLKETRLEHLVEKYTLDGVMDWSSVMSISEMQRLNFARLFLHKPRFCLADEVTSSLDLRLESYLYSACTAKDITMISVAHRPTVIPHHEFVFKYEPAQHTWTHIRSSQCSTVEKFPTDGLMDMPAQVAEDLAIPEDPLQGFNWTFVKRVFRAIGYGFSKSDPWFLVFSFIQMGAMVIYGAMQIIIFRDYGTSKIILWVTGNPTAKPPVPSDFQAAMNGAGTIIGLNAVCAICMTANAFCGALMALRIQKGITTKIQDLYFQPGVVYHANRVKKMHGIDQRLVQDMAGLRESFAWVYGSPFAYFNYRMGAMPLLIMFSILTGYFFQRTWTLALFMFVHAILAYASQLFSAHFTSKIVGNRQIKEGTLRLHLARVLQNIETITFFGGQEEEYQASERMLFDVFWLRNHYALVANATSVPTITLYYWLQTGIYVMSAILLVHWAPGSIQMADIPNGPPGLISTISYGIIWAKIVQLIIQNLGGYGMLVGYTHRVLSLVEQLQECETEVNQTRKAIANSSAGVSLTNVTINLPSVNASGKGADRVVVKNLTANCPLGSSLCFGGCGRSSILRAMAGLWPAHAGSVARPALGKDGIFFVPQQSYACQGTLAAQVVYPKLLEECNPSAKELTEILNAVGLGAIVRRWGLNALVNWELVLSGGECQRLGFARVLYTNPKVAVLDETTSALDIALEDRCMKAVVQRGITLISFATRPSVFDYHEQLAFVSTEGTVTYSQRKTVS